MRSLSRRLSDQSVGRLTARRRASALPAVAGLEEGDEHAVVTAFDARPRLHEHADELRACR